jgi:hypothetical protein
VKRSCLILFGTAASAIALALPGIARAETGDGWTWTDGAAVTDGWTWTDGAAVTDGWTWSDGAAAPDGWTWDGAAEQAPPAGG